MINDAVMLQHTVSNNNVVGTLYIDMQRLTYPRQSAYCAAKNIDFWSFQGGISKSEIDNVEIGSWTKIKLVLDALKEYEYVFWVDVDAAVMDFETDLRDACKDINIGGCVHDPKNSEWLRTNKIDKHINVGVLYVRNTDISKQFFEKWLACYPGDKRWNEQGSFNELIKDMPEAVTVIDDKWNATVNANMVEKPVIKGWHGIPFPDRFLMMKEELSDDHLIFRV